MQKKHLLSLDFAELCDEVVFFGHKKYRAQQILEQLYNGKSLDMAAVPQDLKDALKQKYHLPATKIKQTFVSKKDKTKKILFELFDGALVEGVVMNYKYGKSFCISCQVGCKMGCKFCASGSSFLRNIEAGEMLEMVILAGGAVADRQLTNIVMMGSGEPLDNYNNVIKFLSIVSHHKGLNFSARNISLSTCGLVDGIRKLADSGLKVTLSISLHASEDTKRKIIMPIANKYSIKQVIDAAKYYFDQTGRRVLFEYTMISGINDSADDAKRLASLVRGFATHINLITLNKNENNNLVPSSPERIFEFNGWLKKHGAFGTMRRVLGNDIEGACGQLRAKFVACEGNK